MRELVQHVSYTYPCRADGSAKVSKGEILVYFNEVFDALSKVSSQKRTQLTPAFLGLGDVC